jgi:hypothetical protein
MQQFDFDAPWPLVEPPAFALPTDMRALVVARDALRCEAEESADNSDESEILASADQAIRSGQLSLIDNALRIHVGIALAFGYDDDALAVLGVDEDMLHALEIWDYSRSKVEPPRRA